jgi:hypothetical protein
MKDLVEKMGFETNRRLVREFKNQPVTEVFPGGPVKFRSKLEARWARYLEDVLKPTGEILWWGYECVELHFEGVTTGPVQYTPDFVVVTKDLDVIVYECKGWLEGRDTSKLKRLSQQLPHVKIVLVMDKKDYHKGRVNRYAAAEKYTERIVYAAPLFTKFKIRLQCEIGAFPDDQVEGLDEGGPA